MPTNPVKVWQACFMALVAAIVSAAITTQGQERPAAGDRRGNRCYNGSYWKNCGEPDAPPPVFDPPRPVWRYEACYTDDCIAAKLNSLPYERAAEAKLTTWKNVTYLWYRQ